MIFSVSAFLPLKYSGVAVVPFSVGLHLRVSISPRVDCLPYVIHLIFTCGNQIGCIATPILNQSIPFSIGIHTRNKVNDSRVIILRLLQRIKRFKKMQLRERQRKIHSSTVIEKNLLIIIQFVCICCL